MSNANAYWIVKIAEQDPSCVNRQDMILPLMPLIPISLSNHFFKPVNVNCYSFVTTLALVAVFTSTLGLDLAARVRSDITCLRELDSVIP